MFRILFLLLLAYMAKYKTNALECNQGGKVETCSQDKVCFRDGANTKCEERTACRHLMSETCPREGSVKCCCESPFCNKDEKEKKESSDITLYIILGVCGAVLVIVIVSGVIYFMFCWKARAGTAEYSAVTTSELSTRSVAYNLEPSMIDTFIEQEDRTDELVQAIITENDKEDLLAACLNPVVVKGQLIFSNSPKLVKIITYGTTEHITMMEDLVSDIDMVPKGSRACAGALLKGMISHGAQQFPFHVPQLKAVLKAAKEVVQQECSLLQVPVPCVIYGDIHGQYSDLLRWFNLNGWPNKTRSVFLGDFVDRGSHGIEVIAIMACLKILFPRNIFFCRGNHEEENLNKAYSFYNEVKMRFEDNNPADNIYTYFKQLFIHLPLSALIGEKILGMHGGISPRLTRLQDIRDIKRPIDDFEVGSLACDLVWSDPDLGNGSAEFRPNLDREPKIGIGQLFSAAAVQSTCQKLCIDLVVRGHQAPLHGYARWANGRLITLFSAPGYKGKSQDSVNMGACIEANANGNLVIKQLRVTEEFRQKRIDDVEIRRKSLLERMASEREKKSEKSPV